MSDNSAQLFEERDHVAGIHSPIAPCKLGPEFEHFALVLVQQFARPGSWTALSGDHADIDTACGDAHIDTSAAGQMRGRVKERFSVPERTAFVDPYASAPDIIEHQVTARTSDGEQRYAAQSFWNTYKLFTLVWL